MKSKVLANLVFVLAMAGLTECITTTVLADEVGKNDAKKPRYVPNEIIIKYGKPAADRIEAGLLVGKRIGQMRLSDSLDKLSRRYKAKKVKSLFPKFKENQRRIEAIKSKDRARMSKKEKHILARLARAPKGAKVPDLSRICEIELDLEPGQSLEEVVAAYNRDPDVEYAQLNHSLRLFTVPNDPFYYAQWNMVKIQAPEAWDIHTGSRDVVVAVIDTGVDYLHTDLRNNMWINEAERYGASGVDDDGNGYVDDIYGYDFAYDVGDPMDVLGHGTMCSGILGAEGNNGLDIAGVCWKIRIMAVKFFPDEGEGDEADAAAAVYYAVANGADVTSNSYGGEEDSPVFEEALAYAYSQGVVMVAAAGNDNTSSVRYPASYPNMIAVAATDYVDNKTDYSNYGSWVDIAAPSSYGWASIISLNSGGSIGAGGGTSAACPHVSGACALLLSAYPTLNVDQIYDILMETVDPIEPGICSSNGRLNVFKAMQTGPGPEGSVELDRDYYSCSDQISISMKDSDLEGAGSHTVAVTTNRGDSETVTLFETGPIPGIFEVSVGTTPDDPNIEDGILQTSHDVVITVTYEDSNDGTGNPATATDTAVADCQGPVISNVQIDAVGPRPTVTFETDEPTTAQVRYGLACGGPYTIEADTPDLATQHAIELIGVVPQTDYFFIIEAIDRVGNTSVDANAGACYPFTTDEGPRDIHVPDEYSTIQAAIDVSWDGGTVWVADGTYTGQGNRDIDFIGKAIMVRSENGPNNCIIDCNGSESENHRGFYFHNSEDPCSVLDGFTTANGWAQEGGGILCQNSSPTIRNCIVACNLARDGGGLFNMSGSPLLTDCIFSDNYTEGNGGGIRIEHGNPILADCTFSNNSAGDYGGGMAAADCTVMLTYCTFNKNSAGVRGGAVRNESSTPTFIGCTFSENYSGEDGGGVRNEESGCTFINCTFSENSTAVDGGGMFNIDSDTVLTGCNFVANSAGEEGGGMWNERSSLDINDCNFSDNSADPCGGAIWNRDCTLMLTDCAVVGNLANGCGGGLWDTNSTLVLTDCNIIGNSAGHEGGGIYNTFSDSKMSNCIIAENTNGGICCRDGDLRITGSSIASNRGAGIELLSEWDICYAVIVNCSIAGNGAEGIYSVRNWTTVNNCLVVGNGSDGIFLSSPGTSKIANCTIVANAGDGIELYDRSRGSVDNCIVWDNFGEQIHKQGSGALVRSSNIQDGWPGPGNIDADPCFAETGYWGDVNDPNVHVEPNDSSAVWVQGDYHLLLDSPCLDTGDNATVPVDKTDLDGDANTTEPLPWDLDCNPRIVDGNQDGNSIVDMGAYEFFVPPIQVRMKITPQTLNPGSKGNWVKAHCVLPEGFEVEDVDANTAAVLEPLGIESEYMNVFVNENGLVETEIGFDRAAFCGVGTGGTTVEITVLGLLTSGRQFAGEDTIRITNNNLHCLADLASFWLEAACADPDWCGGFDIDRNSVVNLVDFASFDCCCVGIIGY
jgi:parallel beta-helix repeat protein/predicted outer membrane repeat protein